MRAKITTTFLDGGPAVTTFHELESGSDFLTEAEKLRHFLSTPKGSDFPGRDVATITIERDTILRHPERVCPICGHSISDYFCHNCQRFFSSLVVAEKEVTMD